MTKIMKKTLVSLPSVAEDAAEKSSNQIQYGRKCWKSLQSKENYNHVSLKKIIALIRLALMINDDDIFLSDILRLIIFSFESIITELLYYPNGPNVLYSVLLKFNNYIITCLMFIRWIHEGHFHVNRVNLFLPENIKHDIPLRSMAIITSRKKLNIDLLSILNHFKFEVLPSINLEKLISRFCDELQLPSKLLLNSNKISPH